MIRTIQMWCVLCHLYDGVGSSPMLGWIPPHEAQNQQQQWMNSQLYPNQIQIKSGCNCGFHFIPCAAELHVTVFERRALLILEPLEPHKAYLQLQQFIHNCMSLINIILIAMLWLIHTHRPSGLLSEGSDSFNFFCGPC